MSERLRPSSLGRDSYTKDPVNADYDLAVSRNTVRPGPKMQLFRDKNGTIRAGPSIDLDSLPSSSTCDPSPILGGAHSLDTSTWDPLQVEDLRLGDFIPSARALTKENDRIHRHTEHLRTELRYAVDNRDTSKADVLNQSRSESVPYRQTTIALILPMISQAYRLCNETDPTARSSQSRNDDDRKRQLRESIPEIMNAYTVSWQCLHLPSGFDEKCTEMDTQIFEDAKMGGSLHDVLKSMQASRYTHIKRFMDDALHRYGLDPNYKPQTEVSLLRSTQEGTATPELPVRTTATLSPAQVYRNRLLSDGICGGWLLDPSQATEIQSTGAIPSFTNDLSGGAGGTSNREKNKRKRANVKAKKAILAAEKNKQSEQAKQTEEDEEDEEGEKNKELEALSSAFNAAEVTAFLQRDWPKYGTIYKPCPSE